jgi:hypothetical protein
MKKLKDFEGKKIAISCKTDDEIRAILELNNSTMTIKGVIANKNKKGTNYKFCYRISDGWSSEDDYIQQGYTILPATDFLEEEFIYGQEYEFSNDDDFQSFCKRQYIAKSPCREYFISWNFNEKLPSWFKYCRKINTERTEAITTAKELINKFDIKQEELFNE